MRTPPSDREETQFHQVGEYFHVEWQGVLATCFQERVKFTFQPVFNFPSWLFLAIMVLGSNEEFVAYRWHDTFLLGRGLQPSWSWSESALSLAHKTKRTSRPFWKQPKQKHHTPKKEKQRLLSTKPCCQGRGSVGRRPASRKETPTRHGSLLHVIWSHSLQIYGALP